MEKLHHLALKDMTRLTRLWTMVIWYITMSEGIISILLRRFYTLSCPKAYFIPHVSIGTLISQLYHLASFHEAFKVMLHVKGVWKSSLLLAHEFQGAGIFTGLGSLIEQVVTTAHVELLQPTMSQGNARVVFPTVLGVGKGSRLNTFWEANLVYTLGRVFIKLLTFWTLVGFWLGASILTREEPLWVIGIHTKFIWPQTHALCWFIRVAYSTSKAKLICTVEIFCALTNQGLAHYTVNQSPAVCTQEPVRLTFTQM